MPRRSKHLNRREFMGASVLAAGAASGCGPRVAAAPRVQPAPFPPTFRWGVATSAYQIEGAADADGRGPSVWDVFSANPDNIRDGYSGAMACDHYRRYKEDVALMKRLGVASYRFSVSWTRVMPEGTGTVNERGLDFYKRLLDELGAAGIEPMCTAFHWDYPQALFLRGGWLEPESADWFADYVAVLGRALGDRVRVWATQNEPQMFIGEGLLDGDHAPGVKLAFRDYLRAAHNSLRAHGKAVQALRATVSGARVGYVIAPHLLQPVSEEPADVDAARVQNFTVTSRSQWNNSWWCDPVFLGHYPEQGLAYYAPDVPPELAHDLDLIKQPLDFLGMNIYDAKFVRRGKDGKPEELPWPPGYPRSATKWQHITPGSMYWGPRYFHERYQIPIAITESGLATCDQVFLDGAVHDPQRIDTMHRYLLELARAVAEGVPVDGYWAWALLDNFEWAEGYTQRFGLTYVDYPTQRRMPKDSFEWYRRLIASGGRTLLARPLLPADRVTG